MKNKWQVHWDSEHVFVKASPDDMTWIVTSKKPNVENKKFFGETAWMDSLRYVHDYLDFNALW